MQDRYLRKFCKLHPRILLLYSETLSYFLKPKTNLVQALKAIWRILCEEAHNSPNTTSPYINKGINSDFTSLILVLSGIILLKHHRFRNPAKTLEETDLAWSTQLSDELRMNPRSLTFSDNNIVSLFRSNGGKTTWFRLWDTKMETVLDAFNFNYEYLIDLHLSNLQLE